MPPPHSQPPNAFAAEFLERLAELDEPASAGEAETAGTAQLVPVPGGGFAVLGEGLSLEEGDRPVAILHERSTALLVAAALPSSGREPTYRLGLAADEHGFPLYARARSAGHLTWFDERLLAELNSLDSLTRLPASLAQLLEAGGGLGLERAGRLLERRIRPGAPAGERPAEPAPAADHTLVQAWLDGIEHHDRPALLHLASCRFCQMMARARFLAAGRTAAPPRPTAGGKRQRRKRRRRRRRPARSQGERG